MMDILKTAVKLIMWACVGIVGAILIGIGVEYV